MPIPDKIPAGALYVILNSHASLPETLLRKCVRTTELQSYLNVDNCTRIYL